MASEIQSGTEIICPLCREETTIMEKNKNMKPYFLCRELQAPINLNAPLSVSEGFLTEFVAEDDRETVAQPDAALPTRGTVAEKRLKTC